MDELEPDENRIHRANLTLFCNLYRDRPIVLYTGAGVSMGERGTRWSFPDWRGLIERVLKACGPADLDAALAELKATPDPWDAADLVRDRCGEKTFQESLRAVIQDPVRFPTRRRGKDRGGRARYAKKQLGGEFLRHNTTLNAVVAFCGSLTGRTEPSEKGATYQFRGEPNPRIRAVLTANYDPFLEAASSSKFKIALLKPVAAYGSDAGDLRQIPVFHVHGYVPHPEQQAEERPERTPWHEELVLDSGSYRRAWDSTNAFGPTMVPQIHLLRHYLTLFVGFSFVDPAVRGLLRSIHEELPPGEDGTRRQHFAFVHVRELRDRGDGFYSSIGVRPIPFEVASTIESALARVYRAGLDRDHPGIAVPLPRYASRGRRPLQSEPFLLHKDDYWYVLVRCRNTAVPRRSLPLRAF